MVQREWSRKQWQKATPLPSKSDLRPSKGEGGVLSLFWHSLRLHVTVGHCWLNISFCYTPIETNGGYSAWKALVVLNLPP